MKRRATCWTAPFVPHKRPLRAHIAPGEVRLACAGKPARIVVKVNALTDTTLIEALVRGRPGRRQRRPDRACACSLPPWAIEGLTNNIRVGSVVGRFLEHSRIIYLCWGDEVDDEALYLSSADWMLRNMLRRIELAWPIRDAAMRQRVIDECLVPYLHDTRDAWLLQSNGKYERIGSDGVSAQQALMARFRKRAE